MAERAIDVLLPTCDRPSALAIALTALSSQSFRNFRIVISDQSEECNVFEVPEVAAVLQYKAFDYLDAPIERVGAKFAPLAFAPVMEQFVVPHAEDVHAAIKRTVGK